MQSDMFAESEDGQIPMGDVGHVTSDITGGIAAPYFSLPGVYMENAHPTSPTSPSLIQSEIGDPDDEILF
jgi:hypothetical protein